MIHIEKEMIERLSAAGILAFIAVSIADGSEATTAALAQLVKTPTGKMLSGLQELSTEYPEKVSRFKKKWRCGEIKAGDGEVLQSLDSERYRCFVDDLKKYWDNLNHDLDFAFNGKDGAAARRFLQDHPNWQQSDWRIALVNRKISVTKYGHGSRTDLFYVWARFMDPYFANPLNEYNKPAETGGKVGKALTVEDANRSARSAALGGRRPQS